MPRDRTTGGAGALKQHPTASESCHRQPQYIVGFYLIFDARPTCKQSAHRSCIALLINHAQAATDVVQSVTAFLSPAWLRVSLRVDACVDASRPIYCRQCGLCSLCRCVRCNPSDQKPTPKLWGKAYNPHNLCHEAGSVSLREHHSRNDTGNYFSRLVTAYCACAWASTRLRSATSIRAVSSRRSNGLVM